MPYQYCDLNGKTLRMERHQIEAKVNPQVGALLVPNLFGLASDMSALSEYCYEKRWILVEGADYTFGGSMFGRPFGSFGDITILNFQEGKAIPIGGGMVLSKTAFALESKGTTSTVSNLYALVRSLGYSFLIRPLAYNLFTKALELANVSKKRFSMEDTIRDTRSEGDYSMPDQNMLQGISDFQSKLGLRLLGKLDAQFHSRFSAAVRLETRLKTIPGIELIPRHPAIDRCHYLRYPILVPADARDSLVQFLIKHGFEASPMYVEHGMQIDPHQFPGAARICNQIVTLPCHPLLTDEDIEKLPGLIHRFFTGR
jgi:dTDP-4-amino-4,6-dideoxygalactose transaminase